MDGLIGQGLQLMALGMGVVFLFLGLLIAIITLVSRLIRTFELRGEERATAHPGHDDLREVISAAVKQYRSDHPRRR